MPKKAKTEILTWHDGYAKAATLLLQGKTQKEAAEIVGVTQVTVRNWKLKPLFRRIYNTIARETAQEIKAQLLPEVRKSIRALAEFRDDQTLAKPHRIRAAESLMNYYVKYAGLVDIQEQFYEYEERIAKLENTEE